MFEDDPYPPLITPRSPSYERASQEFLHPTSTGNPQIIATIARLSEAEKNAGDICTAVAQMISDESSARRVRDLADVHHARRQALAQLIEKLGGSAPTPEECREILVQAIDALDRSSDAQAGKQVLQLMRNELKAEYATAIASEELSAAQRAALTQLAPDSGPLP